MIQLSVGTLVLPLEGKSGAGGVMACNRACLGVSRVVEGDNQAVYRKWVGLRGNLGRPLVYLFVYIVQCGVGYQLVLYGAEP